MLGDVVLDQDVVLLVGVGADGGDHCGVALLDFNIGGPLEPAAQVVDRVRDHEALVESGGQLDGPGLDHPHYRVLRLLVDVDVDVLLDAHHVLPQALPYPTSTFPK